MTAKRPWPRFGALVCLLACLAESGCTTYHNITPAPTPGHYFVVETPAFGQASGRSKGNYYSGIREYEVNPEGLLVPVGEKIKTRGDEKEK